MLIDQRVLAVVPARSGSKGIPGKNLELIAGVSLLGWAAIACHGARWIDHAVVSTDSELYAREASRYHLDVPFLRPEELSGDRVPSMDVLRHAVEKSEQYYETEFGLLLLVPPTSPFRSAEDLENCIRMLINLGADSVISVSPVPPKSHPSKTIRIAGARIRASQVSEHFESMRQDLSQYYVQNGVCYAFTRECILETRRVVTDRSYAYVIDRPIVNIDDPIDLAWARFIYESSIANLPQATARLPGTGTPLLEETEG